jgi:Bacterial PH domain
MSAPQQSGQTGRPGRTDTQGQAAPPPEPGPGSGTKPGPAPKRAQPVRPPDVYRSIGALVVWWVWVVFAAANLVDLAIQGHDHFAAMVAAVLVLITGITYIAAFRPRVVAGDENLMIKNPLRDHHVPWSCVESLDLRDSLEIHCRWEDGGPRHRKLYAWAVHSPRRTRVRAEMRARRKVNMEQKERTAFDKLPPEAKAAAVKTDEEQIIDSLRARAAKSKAAGADQAGTVLASTDLASTDLASTVLASTGRPVSHWDRVACAAVLIPAVLVVIVALT